MLKKKIPFIVVCSLFVALFLFSNCNNNSKPDKISTPWGEVETDTVQNQLIFSTEELMDNGEMIVVTISGPDTYYDYHGMKLGTQYLLCEKFAQLLGINLRVDVCRDTTEMVRKLQNGEADMIMYILPRSFLRKNKLRECGVTTDTLRTAWSVSEANKDLANALNKWFNPVLLTQVLKEEQWLFSSNSTKRHVYAPYIDRKNGVISNYDDIFRRHSRLIRWDWRLLAAQCYQESCFDPKACSWAGAKGLMQLMPSTANHLELQENEVYDPEKNIEAATRYLAELSHIFNDIHSIQERQKFVLAAYNGGFFHIKDAQALAKSNGKNHKCWSVVAEYVLKLQHAQYYMAPIVKYGYMRGSETVDYVERIRQRYAQYCGIKYKPHIYSDSTSSSVEDFGIKPQKSRHRNRFAY